MAVLNLNADELLTVKRRGLGVVVSWFMTGMVFVIVCAVGKQSWWENSSGLGSTKPAGDYCELANFDAFLREPANGLSNLGFILLGQIVLLMGIFDIVNKYNKMKLIQQNENENKNEIESIMIRYPIWSILYGLSMIYVGISSFLFHSSLKSFYQTLDVAAIYAMLLFFCPFFIFQCYYTVLIQTTMDQYWKSLLSQRKYIYFLQIILTIVLIVFDILAVIYKKDFNSYVVLPAAFIAIVLANLIWLLLFGPRLLGTSQCKKCFWIGLSAVLITILAFGIRQLDAYVCSHGSWFQMHALFHVVMAFGLLIFYVFFRKQTFLPISDNQSHTPLDNHATEMISVETR